MSQLPSALLLYIGSGCPYCTKVTQYMERNEIQIPIKDVWLDSKAMEELITLTGKKQVPCLRIGNHGLLESEDIIEKLAELFKIS